MDLLKQLHTRKINEHEFFKVCPTCYFTILYFLEHLVMQYFTFRLKEIEILQNSKDIVTLFDINDVKIL